MRGSLTIVGAGIKLASQCTPEAQSAIVDAEVVFAVVDPIVLHWLGQLNERVISLQSLYEAGRSRADTYEHMTETILDAVRNGDRVCAVFYGHPGVFVLPSHEAVERARAEGFDAVMLPGVSAADCLWADLGVDPGRGCQSYEAQDFFVNDRIIDTSAGLVLWQLAVFGDEQFTRLEADASRLSLLVEALLENYPDEHEVIIYEAAILPLSSPRMQRLRLGELAEVSLTQQSTLYVPPLSAPTASPDRLSRLRTS
jgi:uncharacterized protein YabN with tetrapyrrole methylase and pyrophosphatase domain